MILCVVRLSYYNTIFKKRKITDSLITLIQSILLIKTALYYAHNHSQIKFSNITGNASPITDLSLLGEKFFRAYKNMILPWQRKQYIGGVRKLLFSRV